MKDYRQHSLGQLDILLYCLDTSRYCFRGCIPNLYQPFERLKLSRSVLLLPSILLVLRSQLLYLQLLIRFCFILSCP